MFTTRLTMDLFSNYISKILLFLSWTNFKSKKKFIHKLQLAEIFVIFIFSAWLLPGSYLLYVLFIVLTYIFICQLDRPKFRIHLKYNQAHSLKEHLLFTNSAKEEYDQIATEEHFIQELNKYLEKYE